MSRLGKVLGREEFLKRAVTREVEISGGDVVCIRALPASLIVSGAENARDAFETANLLVNSLCDEEGNLFFTREEKAQAMTVDHLALKKLLDAIVELNGLKPTADGEASDPEKN